MFHHSSFLIKINAKTANWKAIVMFLILQTTNKRTIPFDPSIRQKKRIMGGLYHESIDSIWLISTPFPLYSNIELRVLFYFTNAYSRSYIWLTRIVPILKASPAKWIPTAVASNNMTKSETKRMKLMIEQPGKVQLLLSALSLVLPTLESSTR